MTREWSVKTGCHKPPVNVDRVQDLGTPGGSEWPFHTKKWITDLYTGSLPCTCDQYPELHSHKRHGHIFIPSWQYTGFGSSAVQAPMQSVLASTSKLGSIASAVRASWRQSLPDFYIPPMFDPDTPQRAPQSDGHFSIDLVNKIVTYLPTSVCW